VRRAKRASNFPPLMLVRVSAVIPSGPLSCAAHPGGPCVMDASVDSAWLAKLLREQQ